MTIHTSSTKAKLSRKSRPRIKPWHKSLFIADLQRLVDDYDELLENGQLRIAIAILVRHAKEYIR